MCLASATSSPMACSAAETTVDSGVRDDDPAARRGVDVDVVDPHSGPDR